MLIHKENHQLKFIFLYIEVPEFTPLMTSSVRKVTVILCLHVYLLAYIFGKHVIIIVYLHFVYIRA